MGRKRVVCNLPCQGRRGWDAGGSQGHIGAYLMDIFLSRPWGERLQLPVCWLGKGIGE